MALIRELYTIKGTAADNRLAVRQERSAPIIASLDVWLRHHRARASAKSPLGEALAYIAKYREGLGHFLTDGRVEIDNNTVELTIADNKLTKLGEWDEAVLRDEIAGLLAEDFDLSLLGITDEDLDALLRDPDQGEGGAVEGEDDIPEAPVAPISVTGDLWQLGSHRLICGDSTCAGVVGRLLKQTASVLGGRGNRQRPTDRLTCFVHSPSCKIPNPQNLRDLDNTILFYAACECEGETWATCFILMQTANAGIVMMNEALGDHYARCI